MREGSDKVAVRQEEPQMAIDMNGQSLVQGTVSLNASAAQNAAQFGLLSDEVAAAIHDALLIGWNIVELKSRVQIEVLNVAANASSRNATAVPTASTGAMNRVPTDPAHQALIRVEALLGDVGQMAKGAVLQLLPGQASDGMQLTSQWRSLFSQIASLQNKRFASSTTAGTVYDPADKTSLPYLYPSPDYATVGIGDIADKLGDYRLYDVTRRALNCLTLLYTNPDDSLTPGTITGYRWQLMQNILHPSGQHAATPGSEVEQDILAAGQNDGATDAPPQRQESSQDDLDQAIKILSGLVIGLLEAWDGYLRENYYLSGGLENNEVELIAYEAGRSIATLTWSISLKMIPLENALKYASANSNAAGGGSVQNPGNVQNAQDNPLEQMKTWLYTAWTDIFNDHDINRIQNQISALKTALDDAYYRTTKQASPAEKTVLARPDPRLPSNALQSVRHSLDYWQLGVAWACKNKVQAPAPPATSATLTSTAISTAPPSTVAPVSQPLTPIWEPWEWSQTLREALIQQAGVWQSLVLCQQSLHSFAVQSVTQKILSNFMQTFQSVAVQGLFKAAEGTAQEVGNISKQMAQVTKDLVRGYRPMFIAVLIAIAAIIASLIALVLVVGPETLKGLFIGLASLVTGTGLFMGNKLRQISNTLPGEQSVASQVTADAQTAASVTGNLLDHFSGIFGSAGSTIFEAFQHGYEQILIEFDTLNHNVSVAFPLIEFFTANAGKFQEEIRDAYTFLTQIVWSDEERAAEIQQIAQAAFGPIGAIVGGDLLQSASHVGSSASQAFPNRSYGHNAS
jgi:hypothetical protein